MDNKIIDEVIKKEFESNRKDLVSIGYGFKTKEGKRTGEVSLIYRFKKKKSISEIPKDELVPNFINFSGYSFTTDVVEGEVVSLSYEYCPNSFYNWQSWPPQVPNRNFTRPIRCGISITNFTKKANSIGTLGFLAVDNNTNSLVGITNNHVIVKDAWYASLRSMQLERTNAYLDQVTQPNESYTYQYGLYYSLGYVKKYIPLTGLTNPVTYNFADVAAFTINQANIDSFSYRQVGMNNWSLPMSFATTQELDNLLSINPFLFSAGRTSGAKGEGQGKLLVNAVNMYTQANYYKQGVDIAANFARVIEFIASASTTTPGNFCYTPVYAGDSGSALCAEINGVRKIIGLVFAATYIPGGAGAYPDLYLTGMANRIDDVASLLNISAWTGQTVNYTDLNNTESVCLSTNASDRFVILSGKTFWQLGLC